MFLPMNLQIEATGELIHMTYNDLTLPSLIVGEVNSRIFIYFPPSVEESGQFWHTDPSTLDPSTLRGMSGQVLRVKEYYEVMIHKHHCEDVYDLIDLWYFFISIFED